MSFEIDFLLAWFASCIGLTFPTLFRVFLEIRYKVPFRPYISNMVIQPAIGFAIPLILWAELTGKMH